MALFEAIVIFLVGFVSGTVIRWFAGLAAIVALETGKETNVVAA